MSFPEPRLPVVRALGAGVPPGCTSFTAYLAATAPHLLPGRPELAGGPAPGTPGLDVPHGTTIVALTFADGVVIAGDRRATMGNMIAQRDIEKVFITDSFSAVGIAGSAGIAVEMVRLFTVQLEHYEKIEGVPLSLDGKANQLAAMVRGNLGAALQGFVVVPLFAGYDERRERGRVFSYDATGGRYEETDFQTNGSGGVHARNWIKSQWREGMSRDEAVDLALRSLFAAADEDAATGGPDLIRRIFPTVSVIDRDGYSALSDDEIAQRAESLLGGREEGAGL
jgi:proteasome beta subunit